MSSSDGAFRHEGELGDHALSEVLAMVAVFVVQCRGYMSEADASGDGVLVHVGAEDGGLLFA